MFLPIILILYTVANSIILAIWYYGWNTIKARASKNVIYKKVSIIIAARNEEAHIGSLLRCLQNQSYPKENIEIIVVDDHSTDRTSAVVSAYQDVILLNAEKEGKKNAISQAIAKATGEYILTTDADCTMLPSWLLTMAQGIEGADLASAPVYMQTPYTHLTLSERMLVQFQQLEFSALIAIGGASIRLDEPNMCNGANLLYKKEAFKAVDGFHGNDHLASGDDEFLMHKIALTGSITFIKNRDATVYTKPELTWESLLSQRIRWASKHKHYKNIITKMALLIIFLSNMGLLISILMFAFTFNSIYIIPLVIKYISDAIFLQSVYSFFKEKLPYFTLLLFIPMYPIYMLIVAYKANIGGKYQWKGRTQT